jgi:hypothetical protein
MRLSSIALAISVAYGALTPASLFANGEQGVWYDPSDFSTLFTDSAGTTPVTAVEQFVGLMLDKSKGLVLGPELVTTTPQNGATFPFSTFSTSGVLITSAIKTPSGFAGAYWDLGSDIPVGSLLKITISVVINSGAQPKLYIGNGTSGSPANSGTSPLTLVNGSNTGSILITSAGARYLSIGTDSASYNFSVTAISVRVLSGNHATSTGTKRPKLAARYNLLTYSEQFDNASGWSIQNTSVTANSTTAPNGTTTADLLIPNTTNTSFHSLFVSLTWQNVPFTYSISAKAGGYQYLALPVLDGGAYRTSVFDLNAGAVTQTATGATTAISALGNGWYRCSITWTPVAGAGFLYLAAVNTAAYTFGTTSFAGDGTSGIYIWGADLRPASQATGLIGPTYQRVVDAATYDTAGFLPYLQFDGIDDSMSTGSIDFTATDKMTVWAGVRKLSAGTLQLVELSASAAANNGAFSMPQDVGTSTWTFSSRGTNAGVATSANNSYVAPITTVNTGIGNISGDVARLRVNGVQVATDAADQGSGNYGNYPLFIGARDNSTLYFNGWLTSLIVRGAQSTQSQIEATESWVNGKTGAY